ncbi:MAG: bifunctional riboflavin kinase/FAD synthetase [Gammaproteobacteria bacterium]|nr:bifunctional riboflavin kinase/FAD synthetase [Gammaproteobacteria bacterium]
MRLIRGLHNLPRFEKPTAVTIGNFDGVHLGHQRIIQSIREAANARDFLSLVVVFEPQPLEYLQPGRAPARLTPLHEKIKYLAKEKIDYLLCLYFNEELTNISPQAFIDDILIKRLNMRYLCVGEDFRFGFKREGDLALLKKAAKNDDFDLVVTETIALGDERISSTQIRDALFKADFSHAAELLGRPYSFGGRVQRGDQRGRLLGFPTANIALKHDKLVLSGVFAVIVCLAELDLQLDVFGASRRSVLPIHEDSVRSKSNNDADSITRGIELQSHDCYYGVANIGTRPTINDGSKQKLEVYLFDFNGDLYGQRLNILFRHKIRDEQRFDNLDALKSQIQQDVVAAKIFFQMETHND